VVVERVKTHWISHQECLMNSENKKGMYMYMHMYMYMFMYMYMYVYVCVYIVYEYVFCWRVYLCIYVCVYVCVCVCVWYRQVEAVQKVQQEASRQRYMAKFNKRKKQSMYVVCMYVFECVYMYVYYEYERKYMCMCMYMLMCMRMCMCMLDARQARREMNLDSIFLTLDVSG